MATKKKVVVPRPFHEVAFEILEQGKESEAYKKIQEWVGYGQDAVITVVFILTRCVVPEKERPRIVPALIAASKKAGENYEEVNTTVAFALAYFLPGKKDLKELGKLLSEEFLKSEEGSDEEDALRNLLEKLNLDVPKRPEEEAEEEAKAPPAKKAAPKKATKPKAKAKGGKKKPLTK